MAWWCDPEARCLSTVARRNSVVIEDEHLGVNQFRKQHFDNSPLPLSRISNSNGLEWLQMSFRGILEAIGTDLVSGSAAVLRGWSVMLLRTPTRLRLVKVRTDGGRLSLAQTR